MADIVVPEPMLAQAEKKSQAASDLAKQRADSLTPERRREIARKAAKARWAKEKRKKKN